MCVCVLSSAKAMLPDLVGHQKPALAENQRQVTSLALAWGGRKEPPQPSRFGGGGGVATVQISSGEIALVEMT